MALISFDLDGVLQKNPFRSDRPDGVFGHLRRELAPYVQNTDDPEREALRLVLQEHTARMHAGLLVDAHDWDGIVSAVGTRLGYPGRFDIAALVTEYCEKPDLIHLYADGRECLEALTAAGHTLVATTNGFRSYQEPVIRKLGILDLFTAMITPEAVGAAKPELGIFRAAEAYGSPCVHIGDVLPHDVAGAKRAGWQAIYVVQPGAPGATELPADLAALSPWERPARSMEWLAFRLERDRRWHGHPPAELDECLPDAIVTSLLEIPPTVAALIADTGR